MDAFSIEINKWKAWFAAQKLLNIKFQICRRYAVKLIFLLSVTPLWESHYGSAGLHRKYSILTSFHLTSEKKGPKQDSPLVSRLITLDLLRSGPIGWWKVSRVVWTSDGECVFTRFYRVFTTSGNSTVIDNGIVLMKGVSVFKELVSIRTPLWLPCKVQGTLSLKRKKWEKALRYNSMAPGNFFQPWPNLVLLHHLAKSFKSDSQLSAWWRRRGSWGGALGHI